MKILKNNYSETEAAKLETFPAQLTCPHCKSELEYTDADIGVIPVPYANDKQKTFDGKGFVCPCCNGLIILG